MITTCETKKTGERETVESLLIYKFMVVSHATSKHVGANQSCHSCIKIIVRAAVFNNSVLLLRD